MGLLLPLPGDGRSLPRIYEPRRGQVTISRLFNAHRELLSNGRSSRASALITRAIARRLTENSVSNRVDGENRLAANARPSACRYSLRSPRATCSESLPRTDRIAIWHSEKPNSDSGMKALQ